MGQFALAFVERFGKASGKSTGMAQYFKSSSASVNYKKLQRAQQFATREDLFKQLGKLVSSSSQKYYKVRKFEQVREGGKLVEDRTCHISKKTRTLKPTCGREKPPPNKLNNVGGGTGLGGGGTGLGGGGTGMFFR